MRRALAPFTVGLLLLAGCPDSAPPAPPPVLMDGDVPDVVAGADQDRDGLCDSTELTLGTDPAVADTDGDGFPDGVETALGADPRRIDSPARDAYHLLRESEASTLQITFESLVAGEGGDYTGAFEAVGGPDLAGATAASFYDDSVAVFADPMENVAVVDADAEVFRGVVGTTRLGFELRFAFAGNTPRLCTRAYTFRYNVKRSDGRLVDIERRLLLVMPPGDRLESAVWCVADTCR